MDWDAWIKQTVAKRLALPVGARTWGWLSGFAWMFSATLLTRVLSGLSTLAATRFLGPAHFGEANLALALALWIQIPLFLGIPSAVQHYVPGAGPQEKASWLKDATRLILLTGAFTLLGCVLWAQPLARLAGVSTHAFMLGVIWSAGFFVYVLGSSLLAALERFKAKAFAEILFGLVYSGLMFFPLLHRSLSAEGYIKALAAAYCLTGVACCLTTLPHLSWKEPLDRGRTRQLMSYSLIAVIGTLVNALFQSTGRLVINSHLNLNEVGVLSAYQNGSIQISLSLLTVMVTVFFPIASRTPDHHQLWLKLKHLMWIGGIPLTCLFAAVLTAYMRLLGKKYPFEPATLLLFSLAATLTLYQGLLGWFLASGGRRRLLIFGIIGLASGLLFSTCCLWWIPRYHTIAVGWATIVAACMSISLTAWVARTPVKSYNLSL